MKTVRIFAISLLLAFTITVAQDQVSADVSNEFTEFALIPAGNFTMGRTSGDTDASAPSVSVYVSAFCMAKYEVTKALWDEVRTWGLANGYTDLPYGGGKAADHPVQNITWYAMVKWCNARSQKEGLTPCYNVSSVIYKTEYSDAVACNWSANGYRLPTEAEWEKAARGGVSGQRFPWGDTITHSEANYNSGSGYYDVSPTRYYHPAYFTMLPYTSPVGSFAANGYGLYDMVGNVWDVCWDWYSASYYTSGAKDPRGPAFGTQRVSRGGCWYRYASSCRTSDRSYGTPEGLGEYVGFRVARAAVLPSVTTSNVSGLTFDGATLNGKVTANGFEQAVFFDYGLTTSYGSSVAATPASVSGNLATNVSAVLPNLLPHTKYNFRVRALSSWGSAIGSNLSFSTLSRVPVANDDQILALPSAKLVLQVTGNDTDPDDDTLSVAAFTQPGASVGLLAKVGTNLVFTPAARFAGGSFTYTAMDAFGGKSAPATVTLTLAQCTLGDDVTIPADSPPYDLTVTADAPWIVIESIPWLSVTPPTPDTGLVRLIPAPNPSKVSRIGTVIIGGKTHTVTQTGVLLAPVLTAPEAIPKAAISASYDLAIPTVNGPVTYTVSGVMPNGLTLSNLTGRITGFPTTPGTFTLTVLAKNVIGNSNPISFDITVLPFPASLAGSYSATIEDNEPLTDKLGGLMTMSVTATGGVTGTLKLGTGSHAFTGRLNTAADPQAPDPDHAVLKATITRSGKPSVALTVNMNSGSTDLISGDVTLPGPEPVSATLTGSKHVWNTAKNPASIYQGNYTMSLGDNSGNVQGDGFLTFTVSPAGAVAYSGQLADGTVIAPLSATLWATGDVPLFALLYANKGSLNQSFNIDTGRNISGSPHWLKKPQAATVRAYAAGFETTLSATGAGYSASMAASIASPTGGVVLAFSGGSIENVNQYSDLSQAFTVSAAFAATADWLSPVQMKLTRIDVAKGTFTGSMTLKDLNPFNAALPMISRPVSFNGVLLPAAGMATGYFLLPSITGPPANATTSPITSGRVTIYPN